MLTVADLIGSTDPTFVAANDIETKVNAGIARVLSMQTPSGGFGYWPGTVEPHPWASAFGTHFLLDAQKAGYVIPKERIDASLAFMEAELDAKASGVDNAGGNWRQFTGGSTQSYMLFVLAKAGRPRNARMQALLDAMPKNPTGRDLETKFQLQAALWMGGDRRYENDVKNVKVPDGKSRLNDETFYSDSRLRGFALNTMEDLFANAPTTEPLAERIGGELSSSNGLFGSVFDPSEYPPTQELLWNVAGLGKRVRGVAASFKPGVIVADGKTIQPQPVKGPGARSADRTFSIARAGERKQLELKLDDAGKKSVYVVMTSQGVRTDGKYRIGGDGLSLTRTWRRLDGSVVDPSKGGMNLADLVFVELTLTNTKGAKVSNIALVDRLPAGWEIENPRLSRGTAAEWLDPAQNWNADYMDIRDDKLAVFGSLEAGESRKVVYAVRAVTSGSFTIPPADAFAMYDPNVWARVEADVARIEGPWAEFLL